MSLEDPTGRLARWSLLIQQFDFDIVHRPGVVNGNADALSRRPYGTYSLNALESLGFRAQKIFDFQRCDPNLADLIDYLECERLPQDNTRAKCVLLFTSWMTTTFCTILMFRTNEGERVATPNWCCHPSPL